MADDPRNEGKFQWMARLGFFVRGLLYVVIALLVTGAVELTRAIAYLGHAWGAA